MSVKINLHPILSNLVNSDDVVEVNGRTVGQCLDQLVTRFPELKEWIFNKDGHINSIIDVYVNMESSYPEELVKPVTDGDELHIIIVITGG